MAYLRRTFAADLNPKPTRRNHPESPRPIQFVLRPTSTSPQSTPPTSVSSKPSSTTPHYPTLTTASAPAFLVPKFHLGTHFPLVPKALLGHALSLVPIDPRPYGGQTCNIEHGFYFRTTQRGTHFS